MPNSILVVDDEKNLRATFQAFLVNAGYHVETAEDVDSALDTLQHMHCDVVISDILLGRQTGIDLLRTLKEKGLDIPVIMVTGYPNMDTAVEAIRLGAFDYLGKPVTKHDLLHATAKALKFKQLQDENETFQSHLEGIFLSVREGLVSLDPKGIVTACNAAAERLLGLSSSTVGVLSRDIPGMASPVIQSLVQKTLQQQKSASAARHEIVTGEQRSRVVSLNTSPLMLAGGKFAGAVLVIHDETRVAELERNLHERREFQRLIGKSRVMQKVYDLIEDLADVPSTVLISGESGTGKELVADALHDRSPRQNGPFVKVNCAAIPDTLLESELFGHVRGAFTGAIHNRVGRFYKANGGTIFLDEIGDISPRMQQRMLRVLQEKQIEKVGDETPINIDVRVIAATNRDLLDMVRKGEFREDLYYRLNVVLVELPPLRERREDIPMLMEHFRQHFNKELKRLVETIDDEVLDRFMEYDWPGNIRELQHAIEHAFIRCRGSIVRLEHLPANLRGREVPGAAELSAAGDGEEEILCDALRRAGGNKAKAARLLGIDRKTLYRKLEKHAVDSEVLDVPE